MLLRDAAVRIVVVEVLARIGLRRLDGKARRTGLVDDILDDGFGVAGCLLYTSRCV